MDTINQPEKFDALAVPLEGSNLIEASAGTGKTYSIAIMALRLLLEKNIPVNEILMVTFTKAAVAELEERIRLFVRSAYKASLGESTSDETITILVTHSMNARGEEEVQQVLKTAVLFLDETAVLTIHSFCQQTLTAFAFETNQLFGAGTIQDASSVIMEEVNKFWRENITTIPEALLAPLINENLDREYITAIVKEHLSGKKYLAHEEAKTYNINPGHYDNTLTAVNELNKAGDEAANRLYAYIGNNKQQLIDAGKGNAYFNKSILPYMDSPEELVDAVWEKRDKGYVTKAFETTLLPLIQLCKDIEDQLSQQVQEVITEINCFAINKIITGVQEYKLRNNLLSFDDMIVNLHTAVMQDDNQHFIAALRTKYKAVFIDEFQDTDRLQYEIFQKAFGEETILFFIGDPKQSIYAWRKADIFTYFKAYQQVAKRYNMNRNFRSSESLIHAMNRFFEPVPDFDTFSFNNAANEISYIAVESPKPNGKGDLFEAGKPVVPISITPLSNKEEVANAVADTVAGLFTEGKFAIAKDGMARTVNPADVGILVRTNSEGQTIKEALAAKNIPAVTINDAKVLQSAEAVFLLYLLEAISNPTPANINKALLSPFTGYKVKDILQLDDEATIHLFRNYKAKWDADGIYAALMQFAADYNVQYVLLSDNAEAGERIITNLFQLIELVHKIQNDKRFSPAELIGWLQRGIEGMETEGDQYEQRVESDEEAVKIVTIHKSKGLEYNIVIAPYLDFTIEKRNQSFCSFRHPETGDYVSVEKERLTLQQKQWLDEQTEQENRRLLYVAVTRAVYKCFIFQNTYYKSSTLNTFVNAIKAGTGANPAMEQQINFTTPVSMPVAYQGKSPWVPPVQPVPVAFNLLQKNWSRISYTMLSAKSDPVPKPRNGAVTGKYEEFIFNQLTRGARTGNLLHFILENIDFASQDFWTYHIAQAIKRFAPRHEKEYSPMLLQLIEHITQAVISTGTDSFTLAEISSAKRLNELEFDFNVPLFTPSVLQTLRNDDTNISVKYMEQAEGIMNGKVDMFFEHANKYYILDWKSNYLGDELQYYKPDLLQAAMNESNYHLQYLIYTVAVKKYLQNRLPGFRYDKHFGGVIYMFVRGVRSHADTGVFVTRPAIEQIEWLEGILSA